MRFRPMPVLTLILVPALALLAWLGIWQWERMGEKAAAIAAWERRADIAALPLETALCEARAGFLGREITLPDTPAGPSIRFQGRDRDGRPGWRLMSALPLPACFATEARRFMLVQQGFQPLRGDDNVATGRWMIERPPEAGTFAAGNDVEAGIFYRFEPESLARALDAGPIHADAWIIAYSGELPPALAATPPGQHLGYALTWWGMALALLAVYLVLHVQRGRLRFTRR